ncbi:insulin-like growth factor-binding protein complex acid labile subunit [Anopheles maculipalpis]|uniref:insulin-like growth factor-binding protein complex acid labile subunit n=1 Tax=Anopheles maculipalpis TaxID=1496333 RepID=UPI0021598FB2|nr:insulin-like growth factor-binding protein complex acid labile subunit [Anopheles maculipalpis]
MLMYLLVILGATGCLPMCSGRAVPHHRLRGAGIGRLQNTTLTNATLSPIGQLGGEVFLEGCQIENFGPTLFGMLQRISCLTLRGGFIPTVTFHSHTLDTLVIDATGLQLFDVLPSEVAYTRLRILQITRTNLKHLTPHVSLLVGLKRLDLSQNQLTYVDLDVLGAMQRLRDLDLSVNRIVRLDASPELQLAGLRNLWVSYNRLRTFGAFPGAFPALDTVRLIGNAWHCSWVDRARANIIRHGITAFGADYDCPGERQGGLCCYADDALGEEEAQPTTTLEITIGTQPADGDDLTLRESNRSTEPIGVRYGEVEIFL